MPTIPTSELYGRALGMASGDARLELDCRIAQGDVCRLTGDFKLSQAHYRRAVKSALSLKDASSERDALVGLGLALRASGGHKEAIRLFKKCLGWYKKERDREGIAFTLWANQSR